MISAPQITSISQQPTTRHSRWGRWAIALLLFLWFFAYAGFGLRASFDADDLMNMHIAFVTPWGKLLAANLVPFTTVYRPAGSLYYRVVYELAGLHPLPFRLVTYGFHLLNMALLGLLARRLSRSWEIAALTVLLWCYHHRFFDIYMNNGTVYDVLCSTFFLGTLLLWVKIRETGCGPTWPQAISLYLLSVAAVNAKEMGATLPAVMLVYEWIWHRPQWSVRSFAKWFRQTAFIWILIAITAGALAVKMGPGSVLHGHTHYTPYLTFEQFTANQQKFISELLIRVDELLPWTTIVWLWISLFSVAFWSGNRTLLFASLFLAITPLPVAFILTRGFFVMYLPYVGWALYAACLWVTAREALWAAASSRLRNPAKFYWASPIAAGVIAVLLLRTFHSADEVVFYPSRVENHPGRVLTRAVLRDFASVRPCPAQGGKLVLQTDPWPLDDWSHVFITRLICHNSGLEVIRTKRLPAGFPLGGKDLAVDYPAPGQLRVIPRQ